jgi:hypothetical protein
LVSERALRRELIARTEFALLQERLDLLDDALVEPAAPDRLDRGQFRASPPVFLPLVRWSDQTHGQARTAQKGRQGAARGPRLVRGGGLGVAGHEQTEALLGGLGR